MVLKQSVMMCRSKILLLTMLFTLAYGIVHDQVTVRLCVEYFTVAHPPLFTTTSPALLGLGWGVAAAGPVGFLIGSLLASVATSPGLPPVSGRQLASRLGGVFGLTACAAAGMGVLGWFLARLDLVRVPQEWSAAIAPERHAAFMAVWFAHLASYAVGLGGGVALLHRIWRERGRPRRVWLWLPAGRGAWMRLTVLGFALVGVGVWRWGACLHARLG